MKGLTTATLGAGEAAEIARLWRACELVDDGAAMAAEEDFVVAFQRPSMDPGRDTVGVRDGETLVAVGMLHGEVQASVHVLPSHRGRGIGAWLLRWTQEASRAAGHERTCQTLSENDRAAIALLEADGYERRSEDWTFEIELEREPDPPLLPPRYAIRAFEPARDGRDVFRLIADAFGEWREDGPGTYEDWSAETLERPGFVPEHIATVVRGEELAGAAVLIEDEAMIWVAQLAVAGEHRRRGLARALLEHGFAVAWRSGRRRCGLSTQPRTGARGLYEHVGMRVTRTAWEFEKQL